ncbi:MAG TPA: hypothetical protein VGD98_02410 [Ktedonobacteraceae bacterium]
MIDQRQCRRCGGEAIRVVHVNPRGKELRLTPYWVTLGVSMILLIGSFFGIYGSAENHLVLALPGLVLVVVSIGWLILVARMPKRFRCKNAHSWQ